MCRTALKTFESIGCVVEEVLPDYSLDAVWRAFTRIRGWQQGGALLAYYNDTSRRALLKPEAIFEVESGLKLSAYDITAASVVRTGGTKRCAGFSNATTTSSSFRPRAWPSVPMMVRHRSP